MGWARLAGFGVWLWVSGFLNPVHAAQPQEQVVRWQGSTQGGIGFSVDFPRQAPCVPFAEFLEELAERLGPLQASREPNLNFVVQLQAEGSATLEMSDGAEHSVRRLKAANCREVVRSVVFVMALVLDKQAERSITPNVAPTARFPQGDATPEPEPATAEPTPSEPLSPEPSSAPTSPEPTTPPLPLAPKFTPSPKPSEPGHDAQATPPPSMPLEQPAPRIRLGLLGSTESGVSPRMGFGGGLLAGLAPRSHSSALFFRFSAAWMPVTRSNTRVDVSKWGGALTLCPLYVAMGSTLLGVCAGHEVGQLRVVPHLEVPIPRRSLWSSTEAGVVVGRGFGNWRLDVSLLGRRHWLRPVYYVTLLEEQRLLYEVNPWGFFSSIAISYEIS